MPTDVNIQAPHIRQNKLTEQWVIYAPSRGKRPRKQRARVEILEADSHCPFCPGNEAQLQGIILEIKDGEGNPGWRSRVVQNKYPAFVTDEPMKGSSEGIYQVARAYGRHEVVIDSPVHNQGIQSMPVEQIKCMLETYIQRCRSIYEEDEEILNIVVFRNHGAESGTSLVHPHSQITATAIVPWDTQEREEIAEAYYERNGQCLLCDMEEFELRNKKRIVHENGEFVTFVPFAAEVPFETWIVPKKHRSDFKDISETEAAGLAAAMKDIFSRLHELLWDPAYNYVIHSCSRQKNPSPSVHWYMQIRPRTSMRAGFEIGSGMYINPSMPEQDAEALHAKSSIAV